uniref:Uncharacterized protein n=1 Tax=Aegilops tauschii subsp. strangulata TaxID=200361 RepID=A0A452XPA0_AEGTS
MADELDELIDFLSNSSPQVRGAAADIVRGLTGDSDGLRSLAARADRALPALLRLLASVGAGGAGEAAADSLVNLSQDGDLAARLVVLGAVAAAMDVMVKRGGEQPKLARSLVMLLVNLTQVESGISALLQVQPPASHLVTQPCHLSIFSFCSSSPHYACKSIIIFLLW